MQLIIEGADTLGGGPTYLVGRVISHAFDFEARNILRVSIFRVKVANRLVEHPGDGIWEPKGLETR